MAEELKRQAQDYGDRLARCLGQSSELNSDLDEGGKESEVQNYASEPAPNLPMDVRKVEKGGAEDPPEKARS